MTNLLKADYGTDSKSEKEEEMEEAPLETTIREKKLMADQEPEEEVVQEEQPWTDSKEKEKEEESTFESISTSYGTDSN